MYLLHAIMEKRGYWKLREEALDRMLWRTHIWRGYGPVVRQTAEEWLLRWEILFWTWNI